MIKRLFWDERGDLSFFTIFVILSINMVMAFLLLFATIRIECINIRNAAKMELNNVSARIYADTFHSQREANLDSYMGDLYFSSAYQDALRTDFIQGLTDRIVLENETTRCQISGWISVSMEMTAEKLNISFPAMPSFASKCLAKRFLHSPGTLP